MMIEQNFMMKQVCPLSLDSQGYKAHYRILRPPGDRDHFIVTGQIPSDYKCQKKPESRCTKTNQKGPKRELLVPRTGSWYNLLETGSLSNKRNPSVNDSTKIRNLLVDASDPFFKKVDATESRLMAGCPKRPIENEGSKMWTILHEDCSPVRPTKGPETSKPQRRQCCRPATDNAGLQVGVALGTVPEGTAGTAQQKRNVAPRKTWPEIRMQSYDWTKDRPVGIIGGGVRKFPPARDNVREMFLEFENPPEWPYGRKKRSSESQATYMKARDLNLSKNMILLREEGAANGAGFQEVETKDIFDPIVGDKKGVVILKVNGDVIFDEKLYSARKL